MEDLAIVLTIFDGYEDLWDDCIRLIKKNWKNCPPIYVFTNEKIKNWENVKCVAVGKDAEWSKKVQKIKDIVKEKYLLLGSKEFENVFNTKYSYLNSIMLKYQNYCKIYGNCKNLYSFEKYQEEEREEKLRKVTKVLKR